MQARRLIAAVTGLVILVVLLVGKGIENHAHQLNLLEKARAGRQAGRQAGELQAGLLYADVG